MKTQIWAAWWLLLGCARPEPAAPTSRDARVAHASPLERALSDPRPSRETPVRMESGEWQGREPTGRSGVGRPILVVAPTQDPSYGYAPQNPIAIASLRGAPRLFLGALWGPEGQPLEYVRRGSCCSAVAGHPLDVVAIRYRGLEEPLILYFDVYREGPLRVPLGLLGSPR